MLKIKNAVWQWTDIINSIKGLGGRSVIAVIAAVLLLAAGMVALGGLAYSLDKPLAAPENAEDSTENIVTEPVTKEISPALPVKAKGEWRYDEVNKDWRYYKE